jgi:hypothetical protein
VLARAWCQPLKLKPDETYPNFAFNFNLRQYVEALNSRYADRFDTIARDLLDLEDSVGPDRYCLPRHRVPHNP